MKRALLLIAALAASVQAFAQAEPEYKFTTIKELPITSVKDQFRSGTCWCFSSNSFLESELLRTQGKEYDLSEMWVIGHSYSDRASKYVRLDGHLGFSAGSGFGDVFAVYNKYGIVPQSAYNGMEYGTKLPEQGEMDAVLKAYVDAVLRANANAVANKRKTSGITTAWKRGFDATLQAYLGQWPATFQVDGKTYTPESFRDDVIKFNSEDYVNICSFAYQPWGEWCDIEVCDNWRNARGYNMPVKDMIQVIYDALDNGYTVLWGGDVSEEGFSRKTGVAVLPVKKNNIKEPGSDELHWAGKDDVVKAQPEAKAGEIPAEVMVDDAVRQEWYDRKLTTDDHGMHIYGYAKDQNGNKYFLVKNSWGDSGKYHGIWYMSETFIAGKTLNIVVNRKGLSKDLQKKVSK